MPDRESVLGFTNRWYRPGIQNRMVFEIQDGISVYILPPLYYLATKIEAIKGRGGYDLRLSHDFEDFSYVLNNRPDITSQFDELADDDLAEYLSALSLIHI